MATGHGTPDDSAPIKGFRGKNLDGGIHHTCVDALVAFDQAK